MRKCWRCRRTATTAPKCTDLSSHSRTLCDETLPSVRRQRDGRAVGKAPILLQCIYQALGTQRVYIVTRAAARLCHAHLQRRPLAAALQSDLAVVPGRLADQLAQQLQSERLVDSRQVERPHGMPDHHEVDLHAEVALGQNQ